MNADSPQPAVRIERSGIYVWGSVKTGFPEAGGSVSILFDHDGQNSVADWQSDFQELRERWNSLSPELDAVLPGGIEACTLNLIDLRSHLFPSRLVLHFSTTEDRYDWFVRIGSNWEIEIAADGG